MGNDFGPEGIPFATNDHLWVAQKPLGKLFTLFYNSRKWVETENSAQKHILKKNHVICMRASSAGLVPADLDFLVQGIDGTNLLTVQVSPGSAQLIFDALSAVPLLTRGALRTFSVGMMGIELALLRIIVSLLRPYASLDAFKATFYNLDLDITVCEDGSGEGRAFIHFPVWDASMSTSTDPKILKLEKQFWVAFFHLCAVEDATFLDNVLSTGKVKTRVPRFTRAANGTMRADSPVLGTNIKFIPQNRTAPFVFLGTEPNTEEACEMLVAAYNNGGDVSYEEAFCKAYRKLP